MATLRQNILDEQTDIRDLELPKHIRLSSDDEAGQMARPLAKAFSESIDFGAKLARTPHLFED